MRNLVVISEVHGVVEGDDDAKLQVAAAAVDVDNGLFFVASQSSALICYSLSSKVHHSLHPKSPHFGVASATRDAGK